MLSNSEILERAKAISARDGGSWEKHLDASRNESLQQPLEKLVRKPANDDGLRKAAVAAQLRRMPGIGNPDPDRRTEIGECETEVGRVRVAISRDSFSIHGVNILLSEIDSDLRSAVTNSVASFAAAATDLKQTEQRAMIGYLMDAILRRHKFLTASVTEAKSREKYDN